MQIRQNRLLALNADYQTPYVDRVAVAEEVAHSRRLFAEKGWPIDRRDPPLDRGDRGGDHRSLPGTSPEIHRAGLIALGATNRRGLPSLSAQASLWIGRRADRVLASKSATRRLLLESAGIAVDVEPPRSTNAALEAQFLASGGAAAGLAAALARAKALDVSARRPRRAVLLAPTRRFCLMDALFHKPGDMEAAARSSGSSAGRTHVLDFGVCVARDGALLFEGAQSARADHARARRRRQSPLSRRAGPAVLSSVGAYQLEGLGVHLFEAIEGDHIDHSGPADADAARMAARPTGVSRYEPRSRAASLRRRLADRPFALAADPFATG